MARTRVNKAERIAAAKLYLFTAMPAVKKRFEVSVSRGMPFFAYAEDEKMLAYHLNVLHPNKNIQVRLCGFDSNEPNPVSGIKSHVR